LTPKSNGKCEKTESFIAPGTLAIDVVHNVNSKNRVALELTEDLAGKGPLGIIAGFDSKVRDDVTVKGKID